MFEGKIVLITGAGSGIGRAAAIAFARQGARLALAGRQRSTCDATADMVEKECGLRPIVVAADIGSETDVRRLFHRITENAGRLDVAFFNAGVGASGEIISQPLDEFESIIRTNCVGLWLCLKYAMQAMLPQRCGAIVSTLSVHSTRTIFRGTAAYTASKHAALALTKSAAFEAAEHGLRVNAVAPGPIMTDMLIRSSDIVGGIEGWARRVPQARVGTPEEVAEAVLWLSSDCASFVNGAVLTIDGGFLAT